METTEVVIDRWMVKENVVSVYLPIYLSIYLSIYL